MMTTERKAEQQTLHSSHKNEPKCTIRHSAQTTTIPTKREELSVLPEYTGADGVKIYSIDQLPIYWKDDGSLWWLVQRPDGGLCKLMMHD